MDSYCALHSTQRCSNHGEHGDSFHQRAYMTSWRLKILKMKVARKAAGPFVEQRICEFGQRKCNRSQLLLMAMTLMYLSALKLRYGIAVDLTSTKTTLANTLTFPNDTPTTKFDSKAIAKFEGSWREALASAMEAWTLAVAYEARQDMINQT